MTQEPSRSGQDPIGDFQRWLVRSGARSVSREVSDQIRSMLGRSAGPADVWAKATVPPAVPQLLYDTVARRVERGSEALLAHIRRTQPRYVLFGHVHQPLVHRVRIGRSECINVGHFRATGTPYVLEL